MEHYFYYKTNSGVEIIVPGRSHFFDSYIPGICIDLTKMYGRGQEPLTLKKFKELQGKAGTINPTDDIEFVSDKFDINVSKGES